MTGTKTVAERLREIKGASLPCRGDILAFALGRKLDCPIGEDCINCIGRLASEMADTIEAEKTQAVSKALIEEVFKPDSISIGLLRDVAKELEEYAQMIEGATSEDLSHYAWLIRNALNGAKPQLPEGVIWPTYEDGELVKPFDKLPGFDSGGVQKFIWTSSHNGAWQLQDAEGHMLNVMHGEHVKRPEPDTFESILSEMVSAIESEDLIDLAPYTERYHKLKGGE